MYSRILGSSNAEFCLMLTFAQHAKLPADCMFLQFGVSVSAASRTAVTVLTTHTATRIEIKNAMPAGLADTPRIPRRHIVFRAFENASPARAATAVQRASTIELSSPVDYAPIATYGACALLGLG